MRGEEAIVGTGGWRWLSMPLFGLLLTALLFLALGWIIRAPKLQDSGPQEYIEQVKLRPPQEQETPQRDPLQVASDSPPPPPSMPASGGRPDLPPLDIPTLSLEAVDIANVSVPVALGDGGLSLGASGTFGGFGNGGSGNGSGSGGSGSGGGWSGKPLVPLSTARPQMPQWACDQKLDGWVEAEFVVMPNGRVQDVRIIDADPRGVFEAAAIGSISHWIYEPRKQASQVKQRVPMNHEDCAYNW